MSYEGKYLWKHIKKACHLLRSSFLNKQQRIPWGTLSTHHKWQVETKNYSFHNESRKSRDTFDQLQNHKLEFLFIFIYLFIYWSHLPSPYPPKLNELILIFKKKTNFSYLNIAKFGYIHILMDDHHLCNMTPKPTLPPLPQIFKWDFCGTPISIQLNFIQ